MKTAWAVAFGVVMGLLGAGLLLLLGRQPGGTPIKLQPPPSPAPIQVHVIGAVNQPGIYALPAESRVQDAVLAAGGFTPLADLQALNLAAFVQDGGRIFVPALATSTPLVLSGGSRQPSQQNIILVDINMATQAELESLPEIGPETAEKILEYRQQHGAFQTVEEIMDVPGIGPKTFETIRDLITIGTIP